MGKNVEVFGSHSFDKAVKFATHKPTKHDTYYYGVWTSHTKRAQERTIVRGIDGRFYVANERIAALMAARPGWTRI